MNSWKKHIAKYIVTKANEIESEVLGLASMSNNYTYGVFKILPYKEEIFTKINYKVILEPIDEHKYVKRPWYICDLESRMHPNCFDENPVTCIFDDITVATRYAKNLNITEIN